MQIQRAGLQLLNGLRREDARAHRRQRQVASTATATARSSSCALNPKYVKDIPENVDARLIPKTIFGEKYVNLVTPAQPSPHAHRRPVTSSAEDRRLRRWRSTRHSTTCCRCCARSTRRSSTARSRQSPRRCPGAASNSGRPDKSRCVSARDQSAPARDAARLPGTGEGRHDLRPGRPGLRPGTRQLHGHRRTLVEVAAVHLAAQGAHGGQRHHRRFLAQTRRASSRSTSSTRTRSRC